LQHKRIIFYSSETG